MPKASVFENRKWVPLFAGSAALSWACAFPLIKLGLADFGIAGTDTGGKALFAGARFLLAGLVVLAVAKLCGRSFAVPRGKTRWQLVLFGLVNTALHYFFFYLGVSNSPGGRASILDSLGTFLLILAAAVVFREKLTLRSIFGCLLGFSGIVLINLGSTAGQFTLSGDGMLLCSSVCAMAGGLLTRAVTRKMDPLVATGHSLALGGALLILHTHRKIQTMIVRVGIDLVIAHSTIRPEFCNRHILPRLPGQVGAVHRRRSCIGRHRCPQKHQKRRQHSQNSPTHSPYLFSL